MSTEAGAPAVAAPESAPAGTEAEQGKAAEQATEPADDGLNTFQRMAKQARERKEARWKSIQAQKAAPAKGPGDDEEDETPAAAKAVDDKGESKSKPKAADKPGEPERDEHGRFVSADGKPKAKADDKPAAEPKKPEAAAKDAEVVAEAKERAEEAGVKPPEQRQNETAKQYELRISQMIRKEKQLTAENAQLKEKHAEAERKNAENEAIRAALSGDEIDEEAFLKATGRTFEDFVRAIAKGKDGGGAKFKPRVELPAPLAELKTQMQKELDEIKAWKEEQAKQKREAEEAKAKAEREAHVANAKAEDLKACDAWLKAKVEEGKYPYLSSLKDAGAKLRDEVYAQWPEGAPEPDITEVADLLENTLTDRLGTIFTSERAILAALRDPNTRALVSKALGTPIATSSQPQTRNQGQPKAAQAEGPSTLSNKVPQESSVKVDRDPAEESEWVKQQRKEERERAEYHARMRPALKQMAGAMNRE
jgi:hypothetical protein